MNADKSVVWVHLSDLHLCKPKNGWDAHRVLEPLVADLQQMEEDHGLSPHLILFTGDAAYGQIGTGTGENLEDQFDEVHLFLEGVRKAFKREVPQENVFLIPGNHDVDRGAVSEDQVHWRDERCNAELATDHIRKADKLWRRHMERLDAYRQFLEQRGYVHLLEDPLRLIYTAVRPINGLKIGICGFNTAWSSSEDKEHGRLWMAANWQIGELTHQLKDKERELDIRIALAHHPLDWFYENEGRDLESLIELNFQFFLHGHEHHNWVRENRGHVCIGAAACYDRSDRPNGYNFVRLALRTNEKEVWLRRYDRDTGRWTPCPTPDSDDGRWPIGPGPVPKPAPPLAPPLGGPADSGLTVACLRAL